MEEEKNKLENEATYVAEIQMVFKDSSQAQGFEAKLSNLKPAYFQYARPQYNLVATLSSTSYNGDNAVAALTKMREFIKEELSSNEVCHVVVCRVYHVLVSYSALTV
jgi:hypothetical protein